VIRERTLRYIEVEERGLVCDKLINRSVHQSCGLFTSHVGVARSASPHIADRPMGSVAPEIGACEPSWRGLRRRAGRSLAREIDARLASLKGGGDLFLLVGAPALVGSLGCVVLQVKALRLLQ